MTALRRALDKLTDDEAIKLGIVKPAKPVTTREDEIAALLVQAQTFGWLPGLDYYGRIRPVFDPIYWLEAGLSDAEIVAKMQAEVPGIDKRKATTTLRQARKLYSAVAAMKRQGDLTVAEHAQAIALARFHQLERARKYGETTGDWSDYNALAEGWADDSNAAGARARDTQDDVSRQIEAEALADFDREYNRRLVRQAGRELKGEAWEDPDAPADLSGPWDEGARKSNPRRSPRKSTVTKAVRTFRKWHDFDPERVQTVRGGKSIPSVLVRLGTVPEIVYRSDKWTGKPVTYVHATEKPHPILATGPDGRGLYIIGGRVRVTRRGLVG